LPGSDAERDIIDVLFHFGSECVYLLQLCARYNREDGVDEYISNFNKISKDWKIGNNVVSGSGYPVYYKGQKYNMPVKMLKSPSE